MKKGIVDIISSLFVILFLYTGVLKLLDIHHFRWALSESPLMKHTYGLVAAVIPPAEVLVALALLIPFFTYAPRLRKWGLYGAALLMSIFAIYITYMVQFRTDRPCTCGGIISKMNWHQHMYFNILFTGLAFLAIWLNKHRLTNDRDRVAIA